MGPVMGKNTGPWLNCSNVSYAENGCAQAKADIGTLASFGIDYLKIDGDAGADFAFMNQSYPLVSSFLQQARLRTGRSVFFSCSWPAYTTQREMPTQYALMRRHCNSWRAYRDVQPTWASVSGIIEYWGSLYGGNSPLQKDRHSYLDVAGPLAAFRGAAGPGAWCDTLCSSARPLL